MRMLQPQVLRSAYLAAGSVENSHIKAAAGIDASKLNLTGAISNSHIAAGAGIAASKLALTNAITNAHVAAGAAIDESKLSLATYALQSALDAHTGNTGNPHSVTNAQVGGITKSQIFNGSRTAPSRSLGTEYTAGSTARLVMVDVYNEADARVRAWMGPSSADGPAQGVRMENTSTGMNMLSFLVPPGWKYKVDATVGTLSTWYEVDL